MCGIAGFVDNSNKYSSFDHKKITTMMTNAIAHRGPDDTGYWYQDKIGTSLGHRRLSILDLSSNGHQPMVSFSKRYIIVFNGEIYNHSLLRKELNRAQVGISWRGNSDTETLLNCIDVWGIKKTINKCSGMFAFAILDKREKVLSLVRDRVGEKPLYYGMQSGIFLFASELKAIKQHPAFKGIINRNALALQLKYSYIPTPYSIYKGIKKLPPGTILNINLNNLGKSIDSFSEPIAYWSLKSNLQIRNNQFYTGSSNEAIKKLKQLLNNSVQEQMNSDVPLGAFLSGGIDSSLITSIMQAHSSKPINTFSIGFDEEGYNEAPYAKLIANHIGTNHTEMYVSSKDAINVIPKLPMLYDEPFSDSSQIPTYLLSELTSKSVSVSLSGDAGDELFGGYNRYLWTSKVWSRVKFMPMPVRNFISWGLTSISPFAWNKIMGQIISMPIAGDKIHKLASVLTAQSPEDIYMKLISQWVEPEKIVIGIQNSHSLLIDSLINLDSETVEQKMMYIDTLTYLPDDILTKVDRASMGVSLETRVPFLNHHIVEFANQLPLSMKIHNGESKWILRKLLDQYVPRELIDRPKMGFGVPIDSWLRGPLRDWAEELLNEERLVNQGYFYVHQVREMWSDHILGRKNWQHHLWNILMFQAWLENEKKLA